MPLDDRIDISLFSILGKLVRRTIYEFYNSRETLKPIIDIIHNVEIKRTDDHYTVRITTTRPGLIIGKQGRLMDELNQMLNYTVFGIFEDHGITFDILLNEANLWSEMYE